MSNPRKRQAQAFLAASVVALFTAAAAAGDPGTVSSKEAQAQQVLGQINRINIDLTAAVEAYNNANVQLDKIKGDLRDNATQLRVARQTLKRSEIALAQRLVGAYTSGDQNSALAVLLGSSSLDDLLNRMETISSTSKQDARIVHEVTDAKAAIQRHRVQLRRARIEQQHVVAERASQRQHIESQLSQRRQLLSSIKSEIEHLKAQEAARQLQLAAEARARISNTAASPDPSVLGAAAAPSAPVAPAAHGGVVGIAMRYLGVRYVWGGASPSGFDCSGFVMYVFAQIGVALPHSSYAQFGMGAPVSMSQLQPGDLVFFAGASHVGIYIGGGQFIHAPHTGDVVKISSLTGWYSSTFAGGRRI